MVAEVIDGKAVAERVRAQTQAAAADLARQAGAPPALAVVLVGDDPASQVYVRSKIRTTEKLGMRSVPHLLPGDATQGAVEAVLQALADDPEVDGILLQLPLPKHLDADAALRRIPADKDVDGLTEASAGRLLLGQPGLRPCTPSGCVILAKTVREDLSGAHCVVIGRSILVGKPAALLFLNENCTVTLAHSRTADLKAVCRSADILVPAVGRPEMVRGDWVKPGALVIDVGINRVPDPDKGPDATRLVGDAAYDDCAQVAGAITPVPGGVGPMTIACLLRNTVIAAAARRKLVAPDGFAL